MMSALPQTRATTTAVHTRSALHAVKLDPQFPHTGRPTWKITQTKKTSHALIVVAQAASTAGHLLRMNVTALFRVVDLWTHILSRVSLKTTLRPVERGTSYTTTLTETRPERSFMRPQQLLATAVACRPVARRVQRKSCDCRGRCG